MSQNSPKLREILSSAKDIFPEDCAAAVLRRLLAKPGWHLDVALIREFWQCPSLRPIIMDKMLLLDFDDAVKLRSAMEGGE